VIVTNHSRVFNAPSFRIAEPIVILWAFFANLRLIRVYMQSEDAFDRMIGQGE